MDDFTDLFENRYYKKRFGSKYPNNSASHHQHHSCRSPKYEPKFSQGYEDDHFCMSKSTLCVPHPGASASKATIQKPSHTRNQSKSTLCQYKDQSLMNNNTLPYYIVPVLYVPHKPLYEAKKILEPHMYKAYHCKSKHQISKESAGSKKPKTTLKVSPSKSSLTDYSKKPTKCYHGMYELPKEKKNNPHHHSHQYEDKCDSYSFEHYDKYFSKYLDEKRSTSDISFCTEKSFPNISPTPKRSSKYTNETFDVDSEKRRSICKDFPELFGLYASSQNPTESLRPRSAQEEEPTWDSPKTIDAVMLTDIASKNCISAQTSFETIKRYMRDANTSKVNQETQTFIKDISKNVVMEPRPFKEELLTEQLYSKNIDKNSKTKFNDGQLETTSEKHFVSETKGSSIPRFTVNRLTKSRSSRRNIVSENMTTL